MNLWRYIRAPALVAAATFILILGSNALSLGAFGVTSALGIFALAIGATVAAWALLFAIGITVCLLFRLRTPGMILQTVVGIASGSLALWLIGLLLPGTVLLGGLLAAIPYATVNTLMIWALGWITGITKPGLKFLPER